MLRLPSEFQSVISTFSVAFSSRVWIKCQVLLVGSICCPGSRTICNLLRAIGLADEKRFHKYHRFLSTDKWSCLQLSLILLRLLVKAFVAKGKPLVFGIDEHVERRWGPKIKKRGYLPGCGTIFSFSLCQMQRSTLDVFNATDRTSLATSE